jgi:hypothetical protein
MGAAEYLDLLAKLDAPDEKAPLDESFPALAPPGRAPAAVGVLPAYSDVAVNRAALCSPVSTAGASGSGLSWPETRGAPQTQSTGWYDLVTAPAPAPDGHESGDDYEEVELDGDGEGEGADLGKKPADGQAPSHGDGE